ncbi:site-specific integrase [Plebeiibacterium sediminum]|uniref:Site-specific integrase n=1 Tax=Plebeiibacterium sediminum TaxID=2992112 RepID=A0AAE3M6I5_9BACT|nr:site-specific integrase [Plebeiobacterium sediminum]MCW3787495.1 site-specific integrase [Plebeiobacterium sediminum]
MASIKILLKTGKVYSDNRHPVILRVLHERKQNVVTLGFNAKKEEWNKDLQRFSSIAKGYKSKNKALDVYEEKAETILADISKEGMNFCFELFISRFRDENSESSTLFVMYESYINELVERNNVSTASIYNNAFNVIKSYLKNKDVSLYSIDYKFLKSFETFLFKKGNTGGGVHHHMRSLRAVLNEAIRRKYFDTSHYPFSTQFNKTGYSLSHLKSNARPRALSGSDMKLFKNFDVEKYPHYKQAHLMFVFSYYGRGFNFTDMAKLKYCNIYDGRIIYRRSKTGKLINLNYNIHLQEIVNYFQKRNGSSEYIFPILNHIHQSEMQKMNRIKKCRAKFNLELKEMAEILKINVPITSYVARHTYATTLKRNGASVEKIAEGLSHSNLKVVKSYLENFSNEELDKTDDLL